MGLESATFLDGLVNTNPAGTDAVSQGDDHLTLIKSVLQSSFPTITKATYLHLTQTNLASGATTDLGSVASDHINVTGTTTITAFGTVGAGVHKTVRFADVLTLTHSPTALILPSGANIDTAANDVLECYSLGAGNWIVTHYTRASGLAVSVAAVLPNAAVAATTGNITVSLLNDSTTQDGVTLATGDLVLVKSQASAAENGVYVVGVTPVRATAFTTYDQHPGASVYVLGGTVNEDTRWEFTDDLGGTIDSTALTVRRHGGVYGEVRDFAGATAPPGWLICDGANVAQATYVELFAIIGITYGDPGGGGFNLPDCRGRVIAGVDGAAARLTTTHAGGVDGDAVANVGGDEEHTLVEAEMPSHTHEQGDTSGDAGFEGSGMKGVGGTSSGTFTFSAGGDGAHNNVQPTIIMNKIIFAGL